MNLISEAKTIFASSQQLIMVSIFEMNLEMNVK